MKPFQKDTPATTGWILFALQWLAFLIAAFFSSGTPANFGQQDLLVRATPDSGTSTVAVEARDIEKQSDKYFITSPQLENPLSPLANLPEEGLIVVRAAVATIPDPIETYLGRSFDIGIAAMLSALQARGYALAGFAFAWDPRERLASGVSGGKKDATGKDGAGKGRAEWKHRDVPGVLLLRNDLWRDKGRSESAYVLLFLVGEAPSFGVHPKAFAAAANCALHFNRAVPTAVSDLHPKEDCSRLPVSTSRERRLDIIGPGYSGSMQSLATSLATLQCEGRTCSRETAPETWMLSPAATVRDNEEIGQHNFLSMYQRRCTEPMKQAVPSQVNACVAPSKAVPNALHYQSMAPDLGAQLTILIGYLCKKNLLHRHAIEILAEESTYGNAAKDAVNPQNMNCGRPLSITTK